MHARAATFADAGLTKLTGGYALLNNLILPCVACTQISTLNSSLSALTQLTPTP